ncbi:MAG TPA: hypothetical protein VEC12_05440 [Bacteroidia bacterium]|nr:hypothetical protein [Bacteroidia bacterium]
MKTNLLPWLRKASEFIGTLMPEFIMLVLGIMASLWLDDRRETAEAHSKEREILAQVLEDLKADTAKVNRNLVVVTGRMAENARLAEISADSISADFMKTYRNTRLVMNYEPFEHSKSGYIELAAQMERVTDKRLLMNIMSLYEERYKNIEMLNKQHSEYLINTVYNYMSREMPYLTAAGDITAEKVQAFEKMLLSDEFKHLLFFDIRLRVNLEMGYKATFEEQKKLLAEIERELEKG